jgi:hypothetical protein
MANQVTGTLQPLDCTLSPTTVCMMSKGWLSRALSCEICEGESKKGRNEGRQVVLTHGWRQHAMHHTGCGLKLAPVLPRAGTMNRHHCCCCCRHE